MLPFVGRQKEMQQLKNLLDRKVASLVVVKGRRRIGKSRLIEEFAKNFNFFMAEGLPPTKKITAQHQRAAFANALCKTFSMPLPNSSDWSDLFWHLNQQIKDGRTVVLLDEISWMGSKDPTFLGKLKNAWDQYLKKHPKLILVLCGSVSSWVEENILSNTGFVGRIDLELTIEELSLPECDIFWGAKREQVSAYEKFKILSITGGIPRYLEAISPNETAEENIKRLCFTKGNLLYSEFDRIFHDLFSKKSVIYKQILMTLTKNPKASQEQLFAALKMKKSGKLSEYLQKLISAGFIKRDYTWVIGDKELSKLSHFRISDNYIRFYLRYIEPNKDKIDRDVYADRSLTLLPGWESIMGLQFENLVIQNRRIVQHLLRIDPNEIVNDNPYFQRGTTSQPGCQIDYMIQTRYNCLYICEIKFSKNPIGMSVVKAVKEKIKKLTLPKNFSYRPVLIHVNGVDDEVLACEFFASVIDFKSLLN